MRERFREFLLAEKTSHEQAIARINRELEALGVALPAKNSDAILAILAQHPEGLDVPRIAEAFEEAGRTVSDAALYQALSRFARGGAVERGARGVYRLREGVAQPAVATDEAALVKVPLLPGGAAAEPQEGPDPNA